MFNVAIGRDNIRPDLRFVDTVRDAASSVLVATLCASSGSLTHKHGVGTPR
jgi:hypothetical protein